MVKENFAKKLAYYIERADEVEQIEQARDQGSTSIYTLKGDGGIGKTILLQLYRKHLLKQEFPEKLILSYDFDDYRYRTPCDLRMAISEDLGGKYFGDYYAERSILQKSNSNEEITPEQLERIKERVSDEWVKTIESLSIKKPIIIMFDTLDTLTPDDRLDLLKCFFKQPLENVFILIAGRINETNLFEKEVKKAWGKSTSDKIIDGLKIEPLSLEDSQDYFKNHYAYNGAPISEEIEKTLEEKVYQLTLGIPLMVDLFATISLADSSIWEELKGRKITKKPLEADITWFKRELIKRFSRSHKTNELTPLLAHIWPVNYHMLAELKDIDESEAVDLMWIAKDSAYIKILPDPISSLFDDKKTTKALESEQKKIPHFMITLHDIMRDLILEYGFDSTDSNKKDKIEYSQKFLPLSKKIITQVESKLKELKKGGDEENILRYKQLKRSLHIRELKNTLFINPSDGVELFVKLFKSHFGKSKHEHSYFIKQLFEHINYYNNDNYNYINDTNYFNQLNTKKHQGLIVQYLLKEIEFWGARNLNRAEKAMDALKKLDLPQSLYIHTYDEIVEYKIRSGSFKSALDLAAEGIEYCQKEHQDDKLLYKQWFKLLTLKGWALRLIGNTYKADDAYAEAQELPAKYKLKLGSDIPSIEMAHLLNTMSYVKALLREHDQAISLIKEAKDLFTKVDYTRGIGMAESTRGRIEIEFDNYKKAKAYLNSALNYFSLDDLEWRSKIYLGLAHTYWLNSQFGSLFNESSSREDFYLRAKTALKKAEEQDIPTDRAELFHLKANLALSEGENDDALKYYQQCEKHAKEMHALYYQARAMGGQMRIASLKLETNKADTIKRRFNEFIDNNPEEQQDILTIALFRRHIGDFYLLDNKVEKAINSYKEILPELGIHGRYMPFNLTGQMNDLTEFFIRYINAEKDQKEKAKREENIREIGSKLLSFWLREPCESNEQLPRCKTYSRRYSAAYQIMSKWTSGDPDKWDHNED